MAPATEPLVSELRLIRDAAQPADATLGRLEARTGSWTFLCFTLELPWRENRHDVSCIPPGRYRIRKYLSPKHHHVVVALLDVPHRQDVEIHIANKPSELLGCIAPGFRRGKMEGEPAVFYSELAMRLILRRFSGEGTLEVLEAFPKKSQNAP